MLQSSASSSAAESSSLATLLGRVRSSVGSSSLPSPPILALYFASSWCPDCQASAPHVSAAFRSQGPDPAQRLFDLVYVSSDATAAELAGNVEGGWQAVPFDDEQVRSDVKRHFGVCARKEMEALGITVEQRRGGIPTLILLANSTSTVLSRDAIPDIMGEAKLDDPLSSWRALLQSSISVP